MPTPAERRALLFVAAVATLGTGVRGLRASRRDDVPRSDRTALAEQIARVDSAIASGGRRPTASRAPAARAPAARAPSARTPTSNPPSARAQRYPLDSLRQRPIDVDRADSAALDLLPGIGPALAARIIADRSSAGAFGSLDALQRVRGIGPTLATRIAPFVRFSAEARPITTSPVRIEGQRRP